MSFNSFAFLIFLLVVLVIYHAFWRNRIAQNWFLLIASYVYYGAWDWRFLGLIWWSTLVDYTFAILIDRNRRHARWYLLVSLATNLGLLFTFKYFNFFQDSAVALASRLGFEIHPLTLAIVLPVGISFYTFQSLSYTIDVYRGELKARTNLRDFALFVAFFPQLVAGPIERAVTLLPRIERDRRPTSEQLQEGVWLIASGYFKKVFVADNVARVVDQTFSAGFTGSGSDYVIAIWAFAIQIYGDFAGYSDIARGVAKLLGFELMVNFNLPYFSRNPSEFWRRWHISLSTWLRDYLYISLGGNRVSTWKTYRNLFLTMLLGGIWHGAAWTFVIWGAFHGLWLALHRAVQPHLYRFPARAAVFGRLICIALTFHGVCLGWLFFRADSLDQAMGILRVLVTEGPFGPLTTDGVWTLIRFTTPLLALELYQAAKNDAWVLRGASAWVHGLVFGVIFYLIAIYGTVSDAFIYFQF